jgi:hypothetical protein
VKAPLLPSVKVAIVGLINIIIIIHTPLGPLGGRGTPMNQFLYTKALKPLKIQATSEGLGKLIQWQP